MKKFFLVVACCFFISGCSTVPAPSACDKDQNVSYTNPAFNQGVLKAEYIVPCDKPRRINI